MRRLLGLLCLAAALVLVTSGVSNARLQPVVARGPGEVKLSHVRHGVIRIPAGHASGRVTVLVRLRLAPLAARYGPGLLAFGSHRKLNLATSASRVYLARLARAQTRAAAQIRRAIPQARIFLRYRVILNGFALRLPYRSLPRLARLDAVTKIYPSLGYHLETNKSPSVIGADTFWSSTGDQGQGVKIGIVDDGVDMTNPFFNPAGFSYPVGFPLGQKRFTTPKVIVARAFPGPGSGSQGRLPLYRQASFHGTHVAGIAAGDAGTTATAGSDHPQVTGLSGIAPRAWIGNYRVFNTPVLTGGYDAFTPQIVQAFESAVTDGMDVINFSGGGAEPDPSSDALIEATDNVAAAGVVPVISAGNDRDDFGLGSIGSPSNAPAAISVAAVSNLHVFAPELIVTAPGAPPNLQQIPFAYNFQVPTPWEARDQTLVDIGTLNGSDGKPVERHLCAPTGFDPNDPRGTTLPSGSLDGLVALVSRGGCTFASKIERVRAAGGEGVVLVDNRPGEANPIPVNLGFPAGMIADLDGANLRAFMASRGGRTNFRATGEDAPLEIQTGRSGVVTSFSSAGPTNYDHRLKPDVAAPGGQILSSTLPEAGGPFAVFDGTSMAAPHVTGAAALLVQQHPTWTPQQVKSALVSSAGPAWGDTARTTEASVLLEGGGLINVSAANNPKLFTDPTSLSYGFLDSTGAPARKSLLVSLTDAGGGAGTWTIEIHPQAGSAGADISPAASLVTIPPGGTVDVPIVASTTANAPRGDDYGFVVAKRGSDQVRVPYYFSVVLPQIGKAPRVEIKRDQVGDTSGGTSFVNLYRFPTSPFGPSASYTGPPMDEDGAETVYTVHVNSHVANVGAAVIAEGFGALDEPWFLGSLNEDDVQGYAGTPVNVNGLTFTYQYDNAAAGLAFPHEGRYFVSVDSRADPSTGESLRGPYLLHYWQNDVTPPKLRFLTKTVSAGRPMLAAIATDKGSGVDPLSLVIAYKQTLLLAALYDPVSGLALWPLSAFDGVPRLELGRTGVVGLASDYQESKNVDQAGANILPNTEFRNLGVLAVRRPTVTWLLPKKSTCVARNAGLLVTAGAARGVRSVLFFDGRHRIAKVTSAVEGLYQAIWQNRKAARGRHALRAVAVDKRGARASAVRVVRMCHK